MIKGHRKLSIQDLANRGNDVSLEVNWNDTTDIKGCQYIKLQVGLDGEEAVIKRDHLFEVLMLMADEKQQERMVGNYMTYQKVKNYSTTVGIMVKNAVEKGQVVQIPLTISINEKTGEIRVKP